MVEGRTATGGILRMGPGSGVRRRSVRGQAAGLEEVGVLPDRRIAGLPGIDDSPPSLRVEPAKDAPRQADPGIGPVEEQLLELGALGGREPGKRRSGRADELHCQIELVRFLPYALARVGQRVMGGRLAVQALALGWVPARIRPRRCRGETEPSLGRVRRAPRRRTGGAIRRQMLCRRR